MADSPPDSSSIVNVSAGAPIAATTTVQGPGEGGSVLDTLTPLEREGARYGYRAAGRPFGTGRRGLELWLALRAEGAHS